MTEMVKIPPNVWEEIDSRAAAVGRLEAQWFSQEIHSIIVDWQISSPIEQMFVAALYAAARWLVLPVNPAPDMALEPYDYGRALEVTSQWKFERYRIDFRIDYTQWICGDLDGSKGRRVWSHVLVELDGHQFHDQDSRQRSYEKARDRAMTRAGHRVLHFTGGDVVSNATKVAHEVLKTLGAIDPSEDFDPTNPYGCD